jgi:pimeloyl-ACP methyl ester carboxylesterase
MKFPMGYQSFHSDLGFNFQLNRLLSFVPEDELRKIAKEIKSLSDWKKLFLDAAETSERADADLVAAFYYRAAEFFMHPRDPDKVAAYDRFIDIFYRSTGDMGYRRIQIPYDNSMLPALIFQAKGGEKDRIILHGGFDSVMEELTGWAQYFAELNYRVILFEGPGQGAALRKSRLVMTPDWERPVKAVLDHLDVQSCTIIGISLGGYLAPRAAAFEPRIKRVAVVDVLDDFFDCYASRVGESVAVKLRQLLDAKQRPVINDLMSRLTSGKPEMEFALAHGMEVCGATDAFDFLTWLQKLNTAPFSRQITQDFLLLAGAQDHIVPLHQFYRQAKNLVNVRSLTGRIFTAQEQAQNHCQVGNIALVLKFIAAWLDFQMDNTSAPQQS